MIELSQFMQICSLSFKDGVDFSGLSNSSIVVPSNLQLLPGSTDSVDLNFVSLFKVLHLSYHCFIIKITLPLTLQPTMAAKSVQLRCKIVFQLENIPTFLQKNMKIGQTVLKWHRTLFFNTKFVSSLDKSNLLIESYHVL